MLHLRNTTMMLLVFLLVGSSQCYHLGEKEKQLKEELYIVPWQNALQGLHRVECPRGSYVRRVRSYHHNGFEDRQWTVYCGQDGGLGTKASSCQWTDTLNHVTHPVTYICPGNGVLAGWESQYDEELHDRQFRFQCCGLQASRLSNCQFSDYVNYWDGWMDYTLESGKVMVGGISFHLPGVEDRIWNFVICDVI